MKSSRNKEPKNMTYAIKDPRNLYLSIDDTWIDENEGIRTDRIRGYTELEAVNEDLQKYHGMKPVITYHPWQPGHTRQFNFA
jgi:hypothetical protein